jgi:hypothetical protein
MPVVIHVCILHVAMCIFRFAAGMRQPQRRYELQNIRLGVSYRVLQRPENDMRAGRGV